jgi:hypothetical protein
MSVLHFPTSLRRAAAQVALRNVDTATIHKPYKCCGHGSLYRLWHKLKPYDPHIPGGTSTLEDRWFAVYFTIIVWSAVVLA